MVVVIVGLENEVFLPIYNKDLLDYLKLTIYGHFLVIFTEFSYEFTEVMF